MSRKIFDFQKQKAIGDKGEQFFLDCYSKDKPVKCETRKIDFVLENGRTIELKTDTYPMGVTENFFMEFFSDIHTEKIGGPWRSLKDGVDFFVYYYEKDNTFFWFETVKLCRALDELIVQKSAIIKNIRNKGWEAQGYLVKRDDLKDVYFKKDVF